MNSNSIREQLRRNAVALISLVIAITSLLYNTWRNEHSEFNRNQRQASFEMLLKIGELQEIVYLSYYDPEQSDASDFRRGWATVLTIRDLSSVLRSPLPERATALQAIWGENWSGLERRKKASKDAIDDAIDTLRQDTVMSLQDLT